jgi:hypothetical protein
MQAVASDRVLAATFDFDDSTVSFCELQRIGNSVVDADELIPISDYDSPACDCVIEPLALGEVVTCELKADLEERLRLRFAHCGIVHPNIPLKERKDEIR